MFYKVHFQQVVPAAQGWILIFTLEVWERTQNGVHVGGEVET